MSPPPRIKICGLGSPEAARAAAVAGADAIGLVFAEQSPRCVDRAGATAVVAALPPFVEAVGLFADAPLDRVRETAAALGLSTVQLHGDYDADAVRRLHPIRVIRAVPFRDETAETELRGWDEARGELVNLAGLLVDTPDASRHGGTGRAFDWAALRQTLDRIEPSVPIILAGGLRSENVAEGIRTVRPWAVDVSSGVESSRGVKDPERIRAFCRAAQEAEG